MKALPKRKGNPFIFILIPHFFFSLNESPSEKEGKSVHHLDDRHAGVGLNESPSEKEGK